MAREKGDLATAIIVSENRAVLEKNFLVVFNVDSFNKMVPVALAIMATNAHRTMHF